MNMNTEYSRLSFLKLIRKAIYYNATHAAAHPRTSTYQRLVNVVARVLVAADTDYWVIPKALFNPLEPYRSLALYDRPPYSEFKSKILAWLNKATISGNLAGDLPPADPLPDPAPAVVPDTIPMDRLAAIQHVTELRSMVLHLATLWHERHDIADGKKRNSVYPVSFLSCNRPSCARARRLLMETERLAAMIAGYGAAPAAPEPATPVDIPVHCTHCGWDSTVHSTSDIIASDVYQNAGWFCPHCGRQVD